jgi:tRNA threonylcarbamoyladenosine biosynthesis protein TsaB
MKILAVDTATSSCSVAVAVDGDLLAEITLSRNETHSKHLTGLIRQVIQVAGMTLDEIDGFAVTRGPGSFTGLRIGISTVKGLAAASGRPLVGISSLESLAQQACTGEHPVCSMIDARRGEVYVARYRNKNCVLWPEENEQALVPDQALRSMRGTCVFVGNGAVVYRRIIMDHMGKRAHFAPAIQHIIRAATVAQLAWPRFEAGDTDELERFVPTYLRKSDAELNRQKNMLKSNAP